MLFIIKVYFHASIRSCSSCVPGVRWLLAQPGVSRREASSARLHGGAARPSSVRSICAALGAPSCWPVWCSGGNNGGVSVTCSRSLRRMEPATPQPAPCGDVLRPPERRGSPGTETRLARRQPHERLQPQTVIRRAPPAQSQAAPPMGNATRWFGIGCCLPGRNGLALARDFHVCFMYSNATTGRPWARLTCVLRAAHPASASLAG